MTIIYNLILIALDLMALHRVWRLASVTAWFVTLSAAIAVETLLAAAFAKDHFDFFRLCAYIVFLHGQVLLIGSAVALWRAKKPFAVLLALGSAALAGLTCYVFMIEPFWLDVSYRRIVSAKIDEPFRIVVVADLQTDSFGDYERGVLRRVVEEKPDLILLAGDYIQAPAQPYRKISGEINAFLKEINFGATYGVYAVEGNVDPYMAWRDIFKGLDITAVNERKTFDLGKLRLTCLGLGESYYTGTKVYDADLDKFHIVLGHVPNFALGHIEGDLLIAGHTHGGQVRIPLFGPVITHARVPNSWAEGLTVLPGGAKLLVSRGIGMERSFAPRMRFMCRPELMVIDLTPERR